MKSRAIALGASVIALTLAGGGQAAAAGGLGDLGQQVTVKSDTDLGGQKVSGTVEANVNAPVAGLKKQVKQVQGGEVNRPHVAGGDVEAKRRSGNDRSEVSFTSDDRAPAGSLYVDQRRKGQYEAEGKANAGPHRADATLSGVARHRGGARVAAHGRDSKAKRLERDARPALNRSRQVATGLTRTKPEHKNALSPLRAIGRQVGNPIQPSVAGWLVLLLGGTCLGLTQVARRRRRFN